MHLLANLVIILNLRNEWGNSEIPALLLSLIEEYSLREAGLRNRGSHSF